MKLRRLADNHSGITGERDEQAIGQNHFDPLTGNDVIYAYLEAFRQQNTAALIMLMNDASPLELTPVLCNQTASNDRLQQKRTSNTLIESRLVQIAMAA
ncbi:hypothetical protein D3C81_1088140 [compost metagenome]